MITSGAKLGAYEILSPLGAGGMGEVLFGAIRGDGGSVGRFDSNGHK